MHQTIGSIAKTLDEGFEFKISRFRDLDDELTSDGFWWDDMGYNFSLRPLCTSTPPIEEKTSLDLFCLNSARFEAYNSIEVQEQPVQDRKLREAVL